MEPKYHTRPMETVYGFTAIQLATAERSCAVESERASLCRAYQAILARATARREALREMYPLSAPRSESAFGLELRRLRTDRGLSQVALSKRSGLSLTHLNGLERGRSRSPGIFAINRLRDGLQLTDGEFVQLFNLAFARHMEAASCAVSQ